MYLAHAVLKARAMNGKICHVEIVAAANAAQRHEFFPGDFKITVKTLEICGHHVIAEVIMSCRYRGMGCEHRACRHCLQRTREIQPLLHQITHAFQHHERGMTFIDMPYRRLDSHLP